jgi:hypothetical protein
MFVQRLLGTFAKLGPASKLMKGVAHFLLGGATLWWVVEHAGMTGSTVLVHVTEPNVAVILAGQTFWIEERRFAPIECRLRPGQYLLQMKRGDQVLYEEWFTIRRGQEIILTASAPRH